MLIIPAIDIIDGRCVRLCRGDYGSAVVYSADPVETARSFEEAGALRIHIVDLDAARGEGNNRRVITDIRKKVSAVLEVGGGIRTGDDVCTLVDIGVDRLILGTVLARSPELLRNWTEAYGMRFIAGIDARGGEVKAAGWREGTGLQAEDLARTAASGGAVAIIYTDIDRDGTLSGSDLEGTLRMAGVSRLPVILSGGIGGMNDLDEAYRQRDNGIRGVIVGKALYEGRVSLAGAIEKYQDSSEVTQQW